MFLVACCFLLQLYLPARPENGDCPEIEAKPRPDDCLKAASPGVRSGRCCFPGAEKERREHGNQRHPPEDQRLLRLCGLWSMGHDSYDRATSNMQQATSGRNCSLFRRRGLG